MEVIFSMIKNIIINRGDFMEISARNVFEGKIESVEVGAVMANVKIKIESPQLITAIITKESVEKLNLKPGDTASAIIKSTEVMVAK
jgi:molybdopterin-binding protein